VVRFDSCPSALGDNSAVARVSMDYGLGYSIREVSRT
jgi:hypothetical protein